jgi:23S rRNA pseudouridine1911/1915/1917 synthase
MPETDWGYDISRGEFDSWVRAETEDWICIDKPAMVVCHPSKHGPTSSLVGAIRHYRGLEAAHLVFRIDRETSGVVLAAKNRANASQLQRAVGGRMVHKEYIAILTGELRKKVVVDAPLGRDLESPIVAKQGVRPDDGREAKTEFVPLATGGGWSLVRVGMATGRQHQIRAHADHAGFPIVGDKIYGVPPDLFLTFIDKGWTSRHEEKLAHRRQALHARRVVFDLTDERLEFEAPLAGDLVEFCRERIGISDPIGLVG